MKEIENPYVQATIDNFRRTPAQQFPATQPNGNSTRLPHLDQTGL